MISLQVTNLTKKFNRHTVFEKLSFEHNQGVLGIAGSNGSGKSTLLKCLAFLLKANKGQIIWKDGEAELTQKQVKNHIGFAAPYISLYDELSVQENLIFLLEVGGYSSDEDLLQKLLHDVQIPQLKDQLYGSLSTGQKQRAKLAAALVRDPDILILDEPGSNLDEEGHKLVSSIVSKARQEGKLIFLASNDPNEISICDKVVSV